MMINKWKSISIFVISIFLFYSSGFTQDTTTIKVDLDGDNYDETILKIDYLKRDIYELESPSFEQRVKYVNVNKKQDTMLIFDHLYGTDEWNYWAHEVKKFTDINKDGLIDLLYYEGDDVSEETVVIINKKKYFKAIYLGDVEVGEFYRVENLKIVSDFPDNSLKELAYWDNKKENFVGVKIRWLKNKNVSCKEQHYKESKTLKVINPRDMLFIMDFWQGKKKKDKWYKVCSFDICGWIPEEFLSESPPSKIFR